MMKLNNVTKEQLGGDGSCTDQYSSIVVAVVKGKVVLLSEVHFRGLFMTFIPHFFLCLFSADIDVLSKSNKQSVVGLYSCGFQHFLIHGFLKQQWFLEDYRICLTFFSSNSSLKVHHKYSSAT
jgi:hypothetical protein